MSIYAEHGTTGDARGLDSVHFQEVEMHNHARVLALFALALALLAVAGCAAPTATAVPTTPATQVPTSAPAQPQATATTSAASAPTAAPTRAATAAPGAATAVAATETVEPTEEPMQPSNPGGPGPAVTLTGNATNGATVYTANCQSCHGPQGKGGVANPGSADGMIPPLNPVDETMKGSGPKTFATSLDLFIEHGSTPEGPSPALKMPAWGDTKALTPQQIADVIAYIMSLNQ